MELVQRQKLKLENLERVYAAFHNLFTDLFIMYTQSFFFAMYFGVLMYFLKNALMIVVLFTVNQTIKGKMLVIEDC